MTRNGKVKRMRSEYKERHAHKHEATETAESEAPTEVSEQTAEVQANADTSLAEIDSVLDERDETEIDLHYAAWATEQARRARCCEAPLPPFPHYRP
jgi:hypothetical protein